MGFWVQVSESQHFQTSNNILQMVWYHFKASLWKQLVNNIYVLWATIWKMALCKQNEQ